MTKTRDYDRIGFREEDAIRIGLTIGKEYNGFVTLSFDNGRVVYKCEKDGDMFYVVGFKQRGLENES